MNFHEVTRRITQLEGKKIQVNAAQIREVLSVLCDIIFEHPEVIAMLKQNALSRARRKAKKDRYAVAKR